MPASSRPFIRVTVGDRSKDTERGDWSQENGHWSFHEIVTIEAWPDEDVTIGMIVDQQYHVLVAAVTTSTTAVCEANFPMASIIPKLKMEDRDLDGLVYVSEQISLDLLKEGRKIGRVYVSFETKTPPPKGSETAEAWCCVGQRRVTGSSTDLVP